MNRNYIIIIASLTILLFSAIPNVKAAAPSAYTESSFEEVGHANSVSPEFLQAIVEYSDKDVSLEVAAEEIVNLFEQDDDPYYVIGEYLDTADQDLIEEVSNRAIELEREHNKLNY